MHPFSVEIFDRSFTHKWHDQVSDIEYRFDYLAPAENYVTISSSEDITTGDFIYISNLETEYFGVISSISRLQYEQMEIGYKPFESTFETTVMFNTNLQGKPNGDSLEITLKGFIEAQFKNNSDSFQNISALRDITVTSSTKPWGFNLKSDKQDMAKCIVNLYDVLMVRAFQKYGIVVTAIPDMEDRKIDITIGTVLSERCTIEADLPNILSKQITVKETSNTINKLTIWDGTNYTDTEIYYLHPDGSYGNSHSDATANRITPVNNQNWAIEAGQGQTFGQAAAAQANEVFGEAAYKNYIEIEVMNDDDLVDPQGIMIGQAVNVIHDGTSYTSILSGRQIRSTTKLIFGCIRLDLTTIIRIGGN